MLPALGTNPIGINIDASIGVRNSEPSRYLKFCVVSCDTVYDCLFYLTRVWGVLTSIVLAGVGIDFIYHDRFPGYWLIAYAVAIFVAETLWVLTLFFKLTIRADHKLWQIWRYFTILEDWKKSPLYILMGLTTMYKPFKLWLVYLAGSFTIFLGVLHLILYIMRKVLRKRMKKKDHRDLESLESSKFEEVTEVLDDCIPDAIPGSSVSLLDSLHPDHESVLEI